MKTMRYVAKTCASAKVAMKYIEYLGHKVTERYARGVWTRVRDKKLCDLRHETGLPKIKGDIGQTLVRFTLDPDYGTEEFRQTDKSEIVIEYEETEESIEAEYDAEMERVEAEIDGDGEPVEEPASIALREEAERDRGGDDGSVPPTKYPPYRPPNET